jgi:hypothetical protein
VGIDNDLEKTMMGHFFVRHQKKGPDSAGDMVNGSRDAAAPSTKADPALKSIFDLFFLSHREPLENVRIFHPLAQITNVGHVGVSNVETWNTH